MSLFIKIRKLKNDDVSYSIIDGNRVPNSKAIKQKTVLLLGKHSELLKKHPNPEAYANEMLEQLRNERKESMSSDYKIDFSISNKELDSQGKVIEKTGGKNIGYSALSYIYHQLELDEFINNRRRYVKAKYNINSVFQFLIYSRILYPGSKLSEYRNKNKFFFKDEDFTLDDVYLAMDYLLKWRTPMLQQLNSKMISEYGRQSFLFFYDVTNYYFEIDREDEFRRKGVNKQNKPLPQVQMGLFMDENGLPVTYDLYPGNENDVSIFPSALDLPELDMSKSKKIIVADKGMMSYDNIAKIRLEENGYIISQSVRKADKELQDFAVDMSGYVLESGTEEGSRRYVKERLIPRKVLVTNSNDEKKKVSYYNERQVFMYSEAYAMRCKQLRTDAVSKALDYSGTKSFDAKDSNYGKLKYVKKVPLQEGKVTDIEKYLIEFDLEALEQDERFDGFYIICTNVVGEEKAGKKKGTSCKYEDGFLVLNRAVTTSDIIAFYGGLWRIEQTFRVSKTGCLNLRPVYHSKEERIRSHFLIGFVSLLILRILEYRLGWQYSADRIQDALSNIDGHLLPNSNVYQFDFYNEVLDAIGKNLGINYSNHFLKQQNLKRIFAYTKN